MTSESKGIFYAVEGVMLAVLNLNPKRLTTAGAYRLPLGSKI
jgi:hypothetical protein